MTNEVRPNAEIMQLNQTDFLRHLDSVNDVKVRASLLTDYVIAHGLTPETAPAIYFQGMMTLSKLSAAVAIQELGLDLIKQTLRRT